MKLKWKLTVACLKMFFREKEAVFWTLFLPLFMVVLFGFVKFDQLGKVRVGVSAANSDQARAFVTALKRVETLDVLNGPAQDELDALKKGDRDLVVVVASDISTSSPLLVYLNDAKPQETQLGQLIIERVLYQMRTRDNALLLQAKKIHGRKLTYMDFLLPGILAMSIMQMGVFSVAFVFVDLKKRGILRRLRVTPINPNDFILAQVVTRLFVLILQVLVLVAAGRLFFEFHFQGNLTHIFLVGVLGAIVFLAIGFAIAGVSRSEDQVAPLANVVTLPMLLLSGVFFSRTNLPGFVHAITQFFPLTYLADALRSIAVDGATIFQVGPQIAGLSVWALLCCLTAVKLFRWE